MSSFPNPHRQAAKINIRKTDWGEERGRPSLSVHVISTQHSGRSSSTRQVAENKIEKTYL
jgi:hypothetical protein